MTNTDNYRGIIVNHTVSKVFEAILSTSEIYPLASGLQFGFKRESCCSRAVHILGTIVNALSNYFTTYRSIVVPCCLDISMALIIWLVHIGFSF